MFDQIRSVGVRYFYAEVDPPEVQELNRELEADRLQVCPIYLIIALAKVYFLSEQERVFNKIAAPDVKMHITAYCDVVSSPDNLSNKAYRTYYTYYRKEAGKEQLSLIEKHFLKACKWFPTVKGEVTNRHIVNIYNYTIKGLNELNATYAPKNGERDNSITRTIKADIAFLNKALTADEAALKALLELLEAEKFPLKDEIIENNETRDGLMGRLTQALWEEDNFEAISKLFDSMFKNIANMRKGGADTARLAIQFKSKMQSLDALIQHNPRSFLEIKNRIEELDKIRVQQLREKLSNKLIPAAPAAAAAEEPIIAAEPAAAEEYVSPEPALAAQAMPDAEE